MERRPRGATSCAYSRWREWFGAGASTLLSFFGSIALTSTGASSSGRTDIASGTHVFEQQFAVPMLGSGLLAVELAQMAESREGIASERVCAKRAHARCALRRCGSLGARCCASPAPT